jgi:hypothetical protein
MKLLSKGLAHSTFKVLGFCASAYLGLFLAAFCFKYSVHLLSGISSEDLTIQKYRTPDPDPSVNFFSSLEYDFSASNKIYPYSPKDLNRLTPVPAVTGKGVSIWPWKGEFSDFFDLDSTSADLLSRVGSSTSQDSSPDVLAYRSKILSGGTPLEVCMLSTSAFRPLFQRLYAGLSLPESINPFPYPETLRLDAPALSVIDLIRLAKLLALEALLGTYQKSQPMHGDPVLANLRLAEGLFNRPAFVINHIGGLAVTGITLPVVWKVSEEAYLRETDLNRVYQQLGKLDPMKNVTTVVTQDACFAFWPLAQNFDPDNYPVRGRFLSSPLIKPIAVTFSQGMVVLNLWMFRKAVAEQNVFYVKKGGSDLLSTSRLARWIGFYNDARFTEIKLQLARLDLGLQIYQRKTGRVPDSLDQLVPAIFQRLPIDPFTGKSYGYKKLGSGNYLLYSCWIDGKDDGGKPVDISGQKPEDMYKYVFHDAKGDFVWPQHHASGN